MRCPRHTTIGAILAILVVGAAFAAPAGAVIPSGNLVVNPGAEDGPGATNSNDTVAPPGWETAPPFTAVAYGVEAFPSLADSASFGGGANFFAGGFDSQSAGGSIAFQLIDLSVAAPEIDAGIVQANLSAQLGGFGPQEDNMSISAIFLDGSGQAGTAAVAIGPVTAADRNSTTGFVPRSSSTPLGPSTRMAYVSMFAQRTDGTYIDGYADNVSLTLSEGTPAAPPPEEGETLTASVVNGTILIRDRGTGEFRELGADETIPVGSSIDATDGRVRLTSEIDGGTQFTDFYDGQFKFDQSGSGLVTATLEGANFGSCGAKGPRRAQKLAKLWGNGSGKAKSKGRKGSGTVRGTIWLTEERCNGTFFRVQEGVVRVHDNAKDRNVTLKDGDSYLARN